MALIPPQYLNSVISIEVDAKDTTGEPVKRSIATGFLIAIPTGKSNEKGTLYNVSIVTNRHVFEDPKTKRKLEKVFLRFNTVDGEGHYFETSLLKPDGSTLWFKHNDDLVDIAIIPINTTALDSAKVTYYPFHQGDLFFAKDFAEKNITIGDGLYVLGFPMSISGKTRNYVIARQGIIARVDDEVLSNRFFLHRRSCLSRKQRRSSYP